MILQLDRLQKSHPSVDGGGPIEVLSSLDLEVGEGETVAVVGQSGCGKSTLLSLIAGLDRADGGEITLNGECYSQLDEGQLGHYRARTIGIVFQQFHLMPHLSALENISLPLELQRTEGAKERAMELLEQVGLAGRASHFPHQMSGGEAQRVAIARALVIRPKLLLADEPTGNLDERTATLLTDRMFELVEAIGMTLLLVTHNRALSKRCGRTLHLREGRLHASP